MAVFVFCSAYLCRAATIHGVVKWLGICPIHHLACLPVLDHEGFVPRGTIVSLNGLYEEFLQQDGSFSMYIETNWTNTYCSDTMSRMGVTTVSLFRPRCGLHRFGHRCWCS